jgi:hypothetical protein
MVTLPLNTTMAVRLPLLAVAPTGPIHEVLKSSSAWHPFSSSEHGPVSSRTLSGRSASEERLLEARMGSPEPHSQSTEVVPLPAAFQGFFGDPPRSESTCSGCNEAGLCQANGVCIGFHRTKPSPNTEHKKNVDIPRQGSEPSACLSSLCHMWSVRTDLLGNSHRRCSYSNLKIKTRRVEFRVKVDDSKTTNPSTLVAARCGFFLIKPLPRRTDSIFFCSWGVPGAPTPPETHCARTL